MTGPETNLPGTEGTGYPLPSTTAYVARTSVILAGATLLSRILGLVREMLIAKYYGSSGETDCFFYALIIPELLRTLIISGAVSSVFIPLMTRTQREGKSEEAKHLAWVMISFISILSMVVILAGEAAAPALVKFSMVMSWSQDSLAVDKQVLTTELIRIFLPVVFLVSMWGLMGGILNSFDNFHVPGLAPVAWNGTIIILLIVFGRYGDVHDIAWAFVIGHAVQVIVHFPALMKLGIRPVLFRWNHPMLMEFLVLAPAALLAYASGAVNAFVGQGIALNLSESAASSLAYAFRIQQLPMAIFGVSVATAIFPTLSRHAAANNHAGVVHSLSSGIRMVILTTLPAVVFLLVLPVESIRLLLERGVFTSTNTKDVSNALYWYTWAIMPGSIQLLTVRTFFSNKDTRTPAILGMISIAINYFLANFLSRHLGFSGIAISIMSVSWIVVIVSIIILNNRYRNEVSLYRKIGFRNVMILLAAGIIEAIALALYRNSFGEIHGIYRELGFICGGIVLGTVVYLVVLKIFRSEDLETTFRNLFRKR